MERYSMFLDRKNQYCENDYTTKCNLVVINGEGNGIPLQYSCLENPMDGGAW